MFTGISWQSYLLVIGASSTMYYFYVALRYYRDDLAAWFTKKATRRPATKAENVPMQAQHQESLEIAIATGPSSDENGYYELEHLISRIQKTISDAAIRSAHPDEVKGYLELVFREFPSLKNDGMRPAINELVASEAAKQRIPISEAEADKLWEQ